MTYKFKIGKIFFIVFSVSLVSCANYYSKSDLDEISVVNSISNSAVREVEKLSQEEVNQLATNPAARELEFSFPEEVTEKLSRKGIGLVILVDEDLRLSLMGTNGEVIKPCGYVNGSGPRKAYTDEKGTLLKGGCRLSNQKTIRDRNTSISLSRSSGSPYCAEIILGGVIYEYHPTGRPHLYPCH